MAKKQERNLDVQVLLVIARWIDGIDDGTDRPFCHALALREIAAKLDEENS